MSAPVSATGGAALLVYGLASAAAFGWSAVADRDRGGGYGAMFLLGAAMLSLMLFLTQYFQDVLGYSPFMTGLAILPSPPWSAP